MNQQITRPDILDDLEVVNKPIIRLVFAPFGKRVLAAMLDWVIASMIQMAVVMFVSAVMNFFGIVLGYALQWVLFFAGMIFMIAFAYEYFVRQESSSAQATFGKTIMKIRVANVDGTNLDRSQADKRFWSKFFFFFLTGGLGALLALFTKRHQTVHDFAAQTVVIETDMSI
jgi:uncharacterized RDD family membrane protein YckC